MKSSQVVRLLAYVTGKVTQQILVQDEYLLAENRILRAHLPTRLTRPLHRLPKLLRRVGHLQLSPEDGVRP